MFSIYYPTDYYYVQQYIKTRKRADKDHRRKKLIRKQKQHLKRIKSKIQLREIRLNSRRG